MLTFANIRLTFVSSSTGQTRFVPSSRRRYLVLVVMVTRAVLGTINHGDDEETITTVRSLQSLDLFKNVIFVQIWFVPSFW